jgi:hypothetical protein
VAGIDVVHLADALPTATYVAPGHESDGPATSRRVSPDDFPLWLVVADLADGASLSWTGRHGDETVYVLSGALAIADRTCPERGAVVIESDAPAEGRALGPTRVVHMGPIDTDQPRNGLGGPPEPSGHGVHVVGPRGTYAAVTDERDTHYYADSTCARCRLTLLYTSRRVPYVSAPHSHSTDELIHLLWGEIRLGSVVLVPGDTVAIAADRRYGFRSGPQGFGFLNYRRDASAQTIERGSPPRMEGGLVNALEAVMDVR